MNRAGEKIRPPIWAPGVNLAHPLARGLVLAPPLFGGAGAPWDPFGWVFAAHGSAGWGEGLRFDGAAGGYFSVAGGGGLNNVSTGTIVMLVRWRGTQDVSPTNYGPVLGRQSNGSFSQNILGLTNPNPNSGAINWQLEYGTGSGINGATAVGNGVLRHVAITFKSGDHRLYLDGVLDGTSATTGSTADNTSVPLTIGAWIDDGDGWATADIPLILIYNRVLSAGEIAELAADPYVIFRRPQRTPIAGTASYELEITGGDSIYNAHVAELAGADMVGYEPQIIELPGYYRFLDNFDQEIAGRHAVLNSHEQELAGYYGVAYTTFTAEVAGAYRVFTAQELELAGKYNVGYEAMVAELAGRYRVYAGYALEVAGKYAILGSFVSQLAGKYRLHGPDLNEVGRYEIYLGVDGPPNLTATPYGTTFGSSFLTSALAGGHTYHIVARFRDAYGLVSQNINEWLVTTDGSGAVVSTPPADPTDITVSAAAAGTSVVTARYIYDRDGSNQADQWLVYIGVNANPVPGVTTPIVVDMVKADGTARLTYDVPAHSEGDEVRVIVRSRRGINVTDVDSVGSTIYTATVTFLGPDEPDPANLFYGDADEQYQGGVI